MAIATLELFWQFIINPSNKDVMLDGNDTLVKSMQLCNYLDTILGILVLNLAIKTIQTLRLQFDQMGDYAKVFDGVAFVLRLVDLSTYLVDAIDLSVIIQGLISHHDAYNSGLVLGKGLKFVMQGALELSSIF